MPNHIHGIVIIDYSNNVGKYIQQNPIKWDLEKSIINLDI